MDKPKDFNKERFYKLMWEYKVLKANFSFVYLEDNLNQLGEEGWELVTVVESEALPAYVFKRKI